MLSPIVLSVRSVEMGPTECLVEFPLRSHVVLIPLLQVPALLFLSHRLCRVSFHLLSLPLFPANLRLPFALYLFLSSSLFSCQALNPFILLPLVILTGLGS